MRRQASIKGEARHAVEPTKGVWSCAQGGEPRRGRWRRLRAPQGQPHNNTESHPLAAATPLHEGAPAGWGQRGGVGAAHESLLFFGMNDHFRPLGKPAPPRPRRPEPFISEMMVSGPRSTISLVLYQSPWRTGDAGQSARSGGVLQACAVASRGEGRAGFALSGSPASWRPSGKGSCHCRGW